ncbi:MAG: hypothetical protein PHF31_11900 [Methylobacter sp.]|jgi:hypothetical protein|nr:hypothetical protein [Methylobacter sp.]
MPGVMDQGPTSFTPAELMDIRKALNAQAAASGASPIELTAIRQALNSNSFSPYQLGLLNKALGVTHKVSIDLGRSVGAVVPGSESEILDAWVEVSGQRVTDVPVGSKFKARCNAIIHNSAGGAFQRWTATVTVIDTMGGVLKNYQSTLVYRDGFTGNVGSDGIFRQNNMTINEMGDLVMPDAAVNLRFRAWMNDDANINPKYPSQSLW